jgi:hypothetical protein
VTCIIAVEHPKTGKLGIAADGMRVAGGNSVTTLTSNKLIRMDPGILAVSGSCRLQHLVRLHLLREGSPSSVAEVAELIVRAIRADEWAPLRDREGDSVGWNWSAALLWAEGPERAAYFIGGDGSLTRCEPGFPSTSGSGSAEACGCFLGRTRGVAEWDLEAELRLAVEIAAVFDTSTGGAVRVEIL